VVELNSEQLAAHINTKCAGWFIRKLNVAGVKQDGYGHVAESEEHEDDACPTCGEPNRHFMKDGGTAMDEVYGCPNCDS
jgi:hypothetical protein